MNEQKKTFFGLEKHLNEGELVDLWRSFWWIFFKIFIVFENKFKVLQKFILSFPESIRISSQCCVKNTFSNSLLDIKNNEKMKVKIVEKTFENATKNVKILKENI